MEKLNFRNLGKLGTLILGILFFVLFLGGDKALATRKNIVINELMWMGGVSSTDEWIELYNPNSAEVDISNWTITYLSSGTEKLMITLPAGEEIAGNSYFIISHFDKGSSTNLDISPDFFKSSVTLSNTALQIKLYNGDWETTGTLEDTAGSGKTPFAGTNDTADRKNSSMERNADLSDGTLATSWHTAVDSVNLNPFTNGNGVEVVQNGTPSRENSVPAIPPPPPPPPPPLPSDYSKAIFINEIMPDPKEDESANEWIELYNPSDEEVDLDGWQIQDRCGSLHRFTIEDIKIPAHGYAAFTREETKITLNNDKDGVSLFWPDKTLVMKTPMFKKSDEDWSWARQNSGSWAWTTKTTKGYANKFKSPTAEEEPGETSAAIALNKTPIEIKTGNYAKYNNKLVKVRGTVIETSGATFWLDDGSGKAKIYIQEKTKIEKPSMHKGDTFEIVGVVNLYREVWRILPRYQEEVVFVDSAPKEEPVKKVVAPKAKTTVSKISEPETKPPPPEIIKEVKAAETQKIEAPLPTTIEVPRASFWVQFAEAATGLALIFLVLLIVIVRRHPKPIVIGGHFGEDES